jgi:hypothetical protein
VRKKFDAEMFREQAQRVLRCVRLRTEAGWHLGARALRIESTGSSIRLIATDRHAIALSSWDAVSAPFTYHIAKWSLDELFQQSAEISISKLKEVSEDGEYPPYQKILPTTDHRPTKITVDAKEMLSAVERIGVLAKQEMQAFTAYGKPVLVWSEIGVEETPIDFTVKKNGLFIESSNYQAEDSIDAIVRDCQPVDTFRLNAARLIPFLETVKGCVTIYPYSKLVEFTDRQFRFLIMYMRRATAVSEAFSNDEPIFAGGSDNDGAWRSGDALRRGWRLASDPVGFSEKEAPTTRKKEDYEAAEKRTEANSARVGKARQNSLEK